MKTNSAEDSTRPDRPIQSWLVPLRALFRLSRMLSHRIRLGKKLSVGSNVFFGPGCVLNPPGFIRLGNDVAIGAGFYLEANLAVGDGVLFSSHVSIVGNDHRFEDRDRNVFWAGRLPPATVEIEGDNLIGHGVLVVGNVRIGRGCIVGAGSVVTRDLPPYKICYGVPAKPRRDRFSPGHSS